VRLSRVRSPIDGREFNVVQFALVEPDLGPDREQKRIGRLVARQLEGDPDVRDFDACPWCGSKQWLYNGDQHQIPESPHQEPLDFFVNAGTTGIWSAEFICMDCGYCLISYTVADDPHGAGQGIIPL